MKNVAIDCFGNRNDREPERFNTMRGEKHPHLVDAQEGVTYVAFDRASVAAQPIHPIVVTGTLTPIWWGYGAWSSRESLNYDLTNHETRTVQVEE